MPTKVSVLDSTTGLTNLVYGIHAREMVANGAGRYSITDNSQEVAALKGPGVKAQSRRLVTKNGVLGLA